MRNIYIAIILLLFVNTLYGQEVNLYRVNIEGNTTTSDKMFLTRMGFGSKMVITGDITQIDLANPSQSGLLDATNILKDMKEIAFCEFYSQDVVRNQLVKLIVDAYDNNK